MSTNNYIPRNAVAFCAWAKKVVAYAVENHERWGVSAPEKITDALLLDLQVKTDRCDRGDHSPVDTIRRNEVRTAIERDIRSYLQGMVMHNENVTGEDRRLMGLPVYDTIPTPVGDPVGTAMATVTYPNDGALELHIMHVEGTPFDKRANYGVKIAYDVFPFDSPTPGNADTLHRSAFTRQKKELFTFGQDDAGKKAVFCLRYENAKGRAGQWGPIVSAVIP